MYDTNPMQPIIFPEMELPELVVAFFCSFFGGMAIAPHTPDDLRKMAQEKHLQLYRLLTPGGKAFVRKDVEAVEADPKKAIEDMILLLKKSWNVK